MGGTESIPRKLGEAAAQAYRADGRSNIRGQDGQEVMCSDLSHQNVALQLCGTHTNEGESQVRGTS